jgi:hypothetical protein
VLGGVLVGVAGVGDASEMLSQYARACPLYKARACVAAARGNGSARFAISAAHVQSALEALRLWWGMMAHTRSCCLYF